MQPCFIWGFDEHSHHHSLLTYVHFGKTKFLLEMFSPSQVMVLQPVRDSQKRLLSIFQRARSKYPSGSHNNRAMRTGKKKQSCLPRHLSGSYLKTLRFQNKLPAIGQCGTAVHYTNQHMKINSF